MSCYSKEQLENMLENVVNELNLSESAIEKHGPLGTEPSELVRLVLEEKNTAIARLQSTLEAEQKNRCCGNCRYMDTIFDITGERQCGITKFSVDRESDPCERWRTCRG